MRDLFPFIFFGAFILLAIGGGLLTWWANKRRRQAIEQYAIDKGFSYERDDNGQRRPFGHFALFARGQGRHSTNHLLRSDAVTGLQVLLADYHYSTRSSKNNNSTTRQTICLIKHPQIDLPQCSLRRQVRLLDSLGRLFGGQDIDFDDDPEFSRRFVLQGIDEAATRHAFDTTVRDWCCRQKPNLQVECLGAAILVHHGHTLKPEAWGDLLRCAGELMGHWLRPPWLKADEAPAKAAANKPFAQDDNRSELP